MLRKIKNISQKDWIGLGILLIGLIVLNYNYLDRLDVFSDDDDLYWGFGMDYLKGKYRGPDDGALYCLWQLIIQLLTNDAVRTYYINYILMVSLPCFSLYYLLRSLRVGVWISVWLVLLYMFSGLNYPLLPKLTHFAVLVLAIGLAISNYASTLIKRITAAGFTVWLASYVRPELYLACLLLVVWLLIVSIRKRTYKDFLILLSTVVISGVIFGTPIRKNDRSFWTFKVYFAINYMEWYPDQIKLSPWMHFNEINEQIYGHRLESIMDAIKTRPDYVVRHVQTNIVKLLRDTALYAKEYIVMLKDMLPIPYKRYVLPLLMLVALALIDYRQSWRNLWASFKQHWVFGVVLGITLIPTVVATTFFYPRPHYFLYHFYLLYIPLVGILLTSLVFRKLPISYNVPKTMVIVAINLLLIGLFLFPKLRAAAQDQPVANREFIELLRGLNFPKQVNLLGGYPLTYQRYVGEGWTFYYHDNERPSNFVEFLKQKNINCVDVNQRMKDFFEKDSTFQSFVQNPQKYGFKLAKQTPTHNIFSKI